MATFLRYETRCGRLWTVYRDYDGSEVFVSGIHGEALDHRLMYWTDGDTRPMRAVYGSMVIVNGMPTEVPIPASIWARDVCKHWKAVDATQRTSAEIRAEELWKELARTEA